MAKMIYVEGLNLPNLIRFEAEIISGRGKRRISIEVQPATIIAIARALEHTSSVGHAVWHSKNSDRPAPCETCAITEPAR